MLSGISEKREFTLTNREYKTLSDFFYNKTGIVLTAKKKEMVYGRLARRIRTLGLSSFKEYLSMVQGTDGDAEISHMINAVTTNLTKFFREDHHFDHLRDVVLKDLVLRENRPGRKRLRLWSAGCSSGEEAYSMAMMVQEAVPNLAVWDARILATDLDTNMLQIGRTGVYAGVDNCGISKELRARWTVRAERRSVDRLDQLRGTRIRMSDKLKNLIAFKPLNLMESWAMKGPFDAIFCRNVMIYFDMKTKNNLVQRFSDLLKQDGILYVGHSESFPHGIPNYRQAGRTTYQKSVS